MNVIVDYGIGNLNSIKNMIKKVGFDSCISSEENIIANAEKIILPGVGSFEYGMKKLRNSDFFQTLEQKVLSDKTPVLGVCLGAQLLFESSEEGAYVPGLGWIKGRIKKFDFDDNKHEGLKVPHMGWNYVRPIQNSKLLQELDENSRFYFVHSYHFDCQSEQDAMLETTYGYPFISAVEKENILGVQFHPEKSHKFGMKLYRNFLSNY